MTNKLKKRTPLIRRLISIVSVFAIFIMSMPMAMAAEISGTATFKAFRGHPDVNNGATVSMNSATADYSSNTTQTLACGGNSYDNEYVQVNNIQFTAPESVTEACGVYISYYYSAYSGGNIISNNNVVQRMVGNYTNSMGQTGSLPSVDTVGFTPSAGNARGMGQSIKAKFVGSEEEPITNIRLNTASNAFSNCPIIVTTTRYGVMINVTSCRVVTTEYSAELGAMENMADQIAQQNQMMQAMYGEIIALCNAIYTKCGDLESAINLTNSYCSAMLEALSDIASTTNNIYDLLGTQFALLISTIQTESSNIQDAIAQAEAKLEAYLDGAVADSGIADSGTASEDASSTIGDLNDSSGQYESTASDSFAQISADFAGFSGGTLSGVALATDIFSQVFDSLGEYRIVYTFPLLLGVCLVLIGRISRHSGGASSRKEDKEE